ncbi:hypothetical protein AKJ58_00135 [candidate division MSBL1 archaeon SCGC-AAA385D11]|uniref:Uncharacterized protein n=1 Tax=candidate division MSBL1 archaeon SCGC-AAA385D11 TaxID=1698286 RepID=A0A133VPI6_9EURY|nr:hypothetical protein AKJ58_00135 [candidate division MSBL1 archaeon SCGC-AAA385D11]
MKLNLGKEVSILGKSIPVAILILIAITGIASAGLLAHYVTVSGTADVKQSVVFSDETTSKTFSFDGTDVTAGDTRTDIYTLETRAEKPAKVGFSTNQDDLSTSGNEGDVTGIDTSYYFVTTVFAKGSGSATWKDDGTVDISVASDGSGAGVALVPVDRAISDKGDLDSLISQMSVTGTGDIYKQLMIDLDPSDASSNWAQATPNGFFVYSSEGEFVETYSDYSNIDSSYLDKAVVVGAKGQIWRGDGASGGGTVDSITFDGNTYELNKDDRTMLQKSELTFPPLPKEEFDIAVVNDFAVDLEPHQYEITSNVNPL